MHFTRETFGIYSHQIRIIEALKSNLLIITITSRLSSSNIDEMCALKKFANSTSRLDCLYFDSTFFLSEYQYFPSQRQSVETICALASQWINRDPKNIVVMRPPANIGYEFVLLELSNCLRQRIHVSNALYAEYCAIPELSECITQAIEESARIHLCPPECSKSKWQCRTCICLPSVNVENVCIIRPTAMKWSNLKPTDDEMYYEKCGPNDDLYFVCYSNHSSYREIKYLIEYLKPKDIKLNVMPSETHVKQRMIDDLTNMVDSYRPEKTPIVYNNSNSTNYKFDSIKWSEVKCQVVQFDDEIAQTVIKRRKCSEKK